MPHNRHHISPWLSPVAVAAICTVLAGCGFQLRGAPPVSEALQPLSVECDGSIPFDLCDAVKTQLGEGEIALVPADEAKYQIKLKSFSEIRRASAIQLDASAAEYDVRQKVLMDVISAEDIPALANAEVRSSDVYKYDDTNVLAKRREEEDLREKLYQRIAQQVIFRLAPLTPERLEAIRSEFEANQKQSDTGSSTPDDQ
ncbi:LPS-assembly lipoprotein LptE [Marinobacter sp. 1Y8]